MKLRGINGAEGALEFARFGPEVLLSRHRPFLSSTSTRFADATASPRQVRTLHAGGNHRMGAKKKTAATPFLRLRPPPDQPVDPERVLQLLASSDERAHSIG